jgi:hypothetical protein
MTSARLDIYLPQLERELARHGVVDPRALRRIVQETRDHLVDAIERARERGLSFDEAEEEAFARFGPADAVAAQFAAEQRPTTMSRRLLRFAAQIVWGLATGWSPQCADPRRFSAPARPKPEPGPLDLASVHDVPSFRARWRGAPRRAHHMVMARNTATLFKPSATDAVNPGIADDQPQATDTLKRLMAGAAAGSVDPALIAADFRDQLVPALSGARPALARGAALDALTLLDEKRIRRYRATFTDGTQGLWTVVHAADGTVVSLARMESTDVD